MWLITMDLISFHGQNIGKRRVSPEIQNTATKVQHMGFCIFFEGDFQTSMLTTGWVRWDPRRERGGGWASAAASAGMERGMDWEITICVYIFPYFFANLVTCRFFCGSSCGIFYGGLAMIRHENSSEVLIYSGGTNSQARAWDFGNTCAKKDPPRELKTIITWRVTNKGMGGTTTEWMYNYLKISRSIARIRA